MKKYGSLCAVLLLLFACTGSGSPSGKDGGGNGDHGDNGDENAGMFSVALALDVKGNTAKIVKSTTKTDASEVVGLAVNTSAAKAAADPLGTASAFTELEVWFTDARYVKDDGDPADQSASKPYVIAWDAYDPAGTATTSVQGAYADDKVTISPAVSDKPARRKVQVGEDLISKPGGVVVVVMLYKNGSDPDSASLQHQPGGAEGLVARSELKLTQAPEIDLTGVSVSAKGAAGADAGAAKKAATVAAVVAATKGFTVSSAAQGTPTVTLQLADSVKAGAGKTAVEFNTFRVSGTDDGLRGTWFVTGWHSNDDPVVETILSGLELDDTVTAVFTTGKGKLGYVRMEGMGKYGQEVVIIVHLDAKYS